MPGSVCWPCLVPLVAVLVLPGAVLSGVQIAGLVIVAGVFVVRAPGVSARVVVLTGGAGLAGRVVRRARCARADRGAAFGGPGAG